MKQQVAKGIFATVIYNMIGLYIIMTATYDMDLWFLVLLLLTDII